MRNPFLELIQPEVDVPGTFWATVVGTSPLRVQRDTEPVLAVTPKTLEKVAVGDRVLCLWENRQVIVLGVLGGTPPPPEPVLAYPEANRIRIGDSTYRLAGSVVVPSFSSWTWGSSPVWGVVLDVPVPFEPPFPFTFAWSIQEAVGYAAIHPEERFPSGGTHKLHLTQFANNTIGRVSRLQWQLVNA